MVDHDELFKELLTVFFLEFVQAFLPGVTQYLDPASIEFVDKEILRGVFGRGGRRKRHADLVVKARFRGQETFFLIHIENQAKREADFTKRMFRYFARLHEKYDLPIYPVVILSYDAPKDEETNRYDIVFPDFDVLKFTYRAIQLNRLSWQDFLKTPNPAAAALMTKMNIAPQDRVKVASEITRMLITLRLDPAKAQLILGFMETYLKLTAEEVKQYEREIDQLPPEEKETRMRQWTSIGREAEQKGKEELVLNQINRRFGSVPSQVTERLDGLSSEQLNALGVALFDFATSIDLENWLMQQHTRQ